MHVLMRDVASLLTDDPDDADERSLDRFREFRDPDEQPGRDRRGTRQASMRSLGAN
jgi:hypothetical protein